MSVTVDTGLSSRAVIGRFFRQLEEFASEAWWTKLAVHFPSSQASETYRWLGMVPQVREWVGGRQVQPLRGNGLTILNKTWESTIRVDADELRRDKTGQMMLRVSELARRVATHPNKLLTTLIETGDASECYDSFNFFDSAHAEGVSGTQSNLIALDVTAPTAPTEAEMYAAIVKAITQMLTYRDDQGEPLNDGAAEFLVMVPMGFLAPTLLALSGQTLDATSNPLASGKPFKVTWVANTRLTWTSRFVVFRTDGTARPFIFQEELPVQMQVLAEGSELEVNENQHQYGVKAVHAAGYGMWQSACQVTFT